MTLALSSLEDQIRKLEDQGLVTPQKPSNETLYRTPAGSHNPYSRETSERLTSTLRCLSAKVKSTSIPHSAFTLGNLFQLAAAALP